MEDNVKMVLREAGCGRIDWIHLAQDKDQWRALVNTVMKLPSSIKCSEVLEQLSDWRLLEKDSTPWI
jgi:hypothetical protein